MTYTRLCDEIDKLDDIDKRDCKELLHNAYISTMERDKTFLRWIVGDEREQVLYDDFNKAIRKYSRKIKREKVQKTIKGYDIEYFIQYYNSTAIDDNLYI